MMHPLLRANLGIRPAKNRRKASEQSLAAGALPVYDGDRDDIEFYREAQEKRERGERVTTERVDG